VLFFFVVPLMLRRLVRLVAGGSAAAALEVENAVLRHQLVVLRRTVKRPVNGALRFGTASVVTRR
jgi:hypothetical protein